MNLRNIILGLLLSVFLPQVASAQIQAGKSINITISNVPDEDKNTVTGTYPVSESGTVNVPFLGNVRAAGMLDAQFASSLQSQYKSAGIYRNPTIQVFSNVTGKDVASEIVSIGGQVRKTGPVPWVKELTLWQAIQAAGGPTEFGSMHRVILTREGKQKVYDVTQAQFKSIPLQRNDNIEIPQKNWLNH